VKRLGLGKGALVGLCALLFVHCGGRTQGEWSDAESGGAGQGGQATGGKVPRSGGTGGVPATGGSGTGGKINPVTGGTIGTGGVPTTGGTITTGGTVTMCAPGTTNCSNRCVNLNNDANHCGSCNIACGDTGCVGGKCAFGRCPFPLVACGPQCVDPETDRNHCGASGTCAGMQRGEVCGDREQCRAGRCVPLPSSCLDVQKSGKASGDGYYEIFPDPNSTVPEKAYCDMTQFGGGWTRCFSLRNTLDEDFNDNDWFNRCVDWTMAAWSAGQLLIELKDVGGALVYIAQGQRNGPWSYNALTSSAVPSEQSFLGTHKPIQLTTPDQLWITGRSANNQGCAGALGNGYGIMLTPTGAPDFEISLHLLVMPYRLQVGSQAPRQFGFDNLQWYSSSEISFGARMPFDTCFAPPPFLGTFEFYVR
jgi:hypothetical protein